MPYHVAHLYRDALTEDLVASHDRVMVPLYSTWNCAWCITVEINSTVRKCQSRTSDQFPNLPREITLLTVSTV